MKKAIVITVFFGLLVLSCTTAEPEMTSPAEIPEDPVIAADPVPDPVPETEPPVDEPQTFEVTQEIYQQTFEEIEALVIELNNVISRKQFDRWLTYLSRDYIATYNSPEVLNEINQYPQLKDNGVVLKDLRDYFTWVVVPSRSKATLGEIVFVGETRITAYSSFEGKRAKLYELERIDGIWKITVL